MSALDELITKPTKEMTELEYAVFLLYDQYDDDKLSANAATELAAKDVELSALREANTSLEGMVERLAQADAQKYREIIVLRERVAGLEGFKIAVEETLELHPSHWESQIKSELEKLKGE